MEEKRHAEISEVAKVADILEIMLEDMAFIDSFPVGRWLTRPEYEDKEWVQSWQTLYRENIQKAIDILRDRAKPSVKRNKFREPFPKLQASSHMKVEAIPLKILEVRKQDVPDGRLQKLIAYRTVLRGLINYHKRMVFPMQAQSTCDYTGEECPKISVVNDLYLGALEESLALIEREISALSC